MASPTNWASKSAKAASALNHPHVCVVYDVGETNDGLPFIAMEFLDGHDLQKTVRRNPAMTLERKVQIIIQVSDNSGGNVFVGRLWREIQIEIIIVQTGDDGSIAFIIGCRFRNDIGPVFFQNITDRIFDLNIRNATFRLFFQCKIKIDAVIKEATGRFFKEFDRHTGHFRRLGDINLAEGGLQFIKVTDQFLQFRFIGVGWLVVSDEGLGLSPIWLGIVGLSAALPTIAFSVPAGILADRYEHRWILAWSQGATAVLSLLLALGILQGLVNVWLLLAWAVTAGCLTAVSMPASRAASRSLIHSPM